MSDFDPIKERWATEAVTGLYETDIVIERRIEGREYPILVGGTAGDEENIEDARIAVQTADRMVADHNAMLGIPDPAAFMAEVRRVLKDAKRLRDYAEKETMAEFVHHRSGKKWYDKGNAVEACIDALLAQMEGK